MDQVVHTEKGAIFVKKSNKLFIAVIAGVVVIAGLITALGVYESINKKAISSLETFIESYDKLQDKFADAEDPETTALLDDLTNFGGKNFGYPAARAFLMAGNIYKEKKEWASAEEAWLESAKKGAKTHLAPLAFFNAAVAAEEQGNIEKAIEYYTKCIAFSDFPSAGHAQFAIGSLKETLNDTEAALEAYRSVLEKWPKDTTWTNLAQSRIIALGL